MLAALGLGLQDSGVYSYLVGTTPATCEEVGAAIGMRPSDATAAIARLEQLGFVYQFGRDPVRYAAAPPTMVDASLSRRLTELRQARASVRHMAAQYRAVRHTARETGVFQVIRGAGALRERMLDMLSSARSEALNMVKLPVVAVHANEGVAPGGAVRGRIIFDREVVSDSQTLDAIRRNVAGSETTEIRVHSLVPMKLMAIDRKQALLPLVREDASVGVIIGESAMLDSILALFDYVWDTAVRLDLGSAGPGAGTAGSPLTPADRQLLSLLLAGLTDRAIASHMHVSVRTVERRTRALMDTAHVRTRMQLAWEASRQRWL